VHFKRSVCLILLYDSCSVHAAVFGRSCFPLEIMIDLGMALFQVFIEEVFRFLVERLGPMLLGSLRICHVPGFLNLNRILVLIKLSGSSRIDLTLLHLPRLMSSQSMIGSN